MPLYIYRSSTNPPGWSTEVKEVYVKSTIGGTSAWRYVSEIYLKQNGLWSSIWQDINITGGNSVVSDIGANFRYHIFTSSANLVVSNGTRNGHVWLIGGGGGAGTSNSSGGGSGARITTWTPVALNFGTYNITVGAGGTAGTAGGTSSISKNSIVLVSSLGGNPGNSGVSGIGGSNGIYSGGTGTSFSRSGSCGDARTGYIGGGGAGSASNGTNAIGENSAGQGGNGTVVTPSSVFGTNAHGRGGTSGQDGFAAVGAYSYTQRTFKGSRTISCSGVGGATTYAGGSAQAGYGCGGGTAGNPGSSGFVVVRYQITT